MIRCSSPFRLAFQALLALLGLVALTACRTVDAPASGHVFVEGQTCAECHGAALTASAFDHASVGYSRDCAECHSETNWIPTRRPDHAAFPLTGAHAAAPCRDCHAPGRADPQPKDCLGCHADDRASAEPPHAPLPAACQDCHNTTAWRPAAFDHAQIWPLTGGHRVAACDDCHRGGVFEGTPRACIGCHADDRDGASNPVHLGFPETCEGCHTTGAWRPSTFDHAMTFPLLGAHARADCQSCHADARFAGTPRECIGCHADDRQRARPDHTGLPERCEACHTAEAWRPAQLDHDQYWRLNGAHVGADCAGCHPAGRYANTPRDCASCHRDQRPAEPDHTGFAETCESCHSTTAWRPAALDHDRFYPLTGLHVGADCAGCHPGGRYEGTPNTCRACHVADAGRAAVPHDGFPPDCAECHTTAGWAGATFDHGLFFPLEGRHVRLACEQCHVDGRFAGTPRTCVGCHADDRAGARPDHTGFPDLCTACHTQNAWLPGLLNHDQYWHLAGPHAAAQCNDCHAGGRFANTPTQCVGCHADDRARAVNPDHSGLPDRCDACHQVNAWRPAQLDHDPFWPLIGPHDTPDCNACHAGGRFAGTPRECVGCHRADAAAVVDPDHDGLPERCDACHLSTAWRPANLNHDPFYPLRGPHAAADCNACHAGGRYAGTPRTCVGCHRADAAAVVDPPHADFPETCQDCHADTAWLPATIHHENFWPLSRPHAAARCDACHAGGRFAGTPRECIGCHRADAAAVVDPRHADFPDTCLDCHGDVAWRPAAVDHDRYWPLDGAHAVTPCAECHVGGHYAGTPRDCAGCHRADAAAVLNPSHARFPETCLTCHTQVAWAPATFDHARAFPLVEAHARLACDDCHGNGVYEGTPRTCIGCHAADKATALPTHVRLSDVCTPCHTQTAWRPATYRHRFVVPHRGVSACLDCHQNARDYGVFACTTCHEHTRANTDPEHREVANYVYADAECVRCHPTGRGD